MVGFTLPSLLVVEPGILFLILLCVGKFGVASAFNNIYVYTAELFPTFLRNTAVGAGATSSRLGGCIAPTLVLLFSRLGTNPLVFFGLFALVGTFSVSTLPETRGRCLPETIKEMKCENDPEIDSISDTSSSHSLVK
mmetsp:Transcript_50736/g.58175  ORF Transcript_50736/g.58175 Transcript_50736/m.58175 type:complete len:137 (+) Transcript_50736:1-411(+)